jgi:hypothetical protein
VQVVYFDEVKYEKNRSPFYWLGAIVADAEQIQNLERQVNDLAEEIFGTRTLTKETEFHAADILSGNKQFKGWDASRRVGTLKRLVSIFGSARGVARHAHR